MQKNLLAFLKIFWDFPDSSQEVVVVLQANLVEAQDMIRRLEEQLRQLQAAKEELEERQNELQAMMIRLEETKVCTIYYGSLVYSTKVFLPLFFMIPWYIQYLIMCSYPSIAI